MKVWTIVGLAIAAVLVAAGIAFNDGSESRGAVASVLVVFGGAAACVCIAVWAAYAMGAGRPSSTGASPRLPRLVDDLVRAATTAENQGVLALLGTAIEDRQPLFARGVEMLVAAEHPQDLRKTLQMHADSEANISRSASSRVVGLCRLLPLLALGMAFATTIWMIVSVRSGRLGTLTPFGLLVSVYGSFAIAAVASEWGRRAGQSGSEVELTGILVIEAVVAIRNGEPPDRVRTRLEGLIGSAAPRQADALRRAA